MSRFPNPAFPLKANRVHEVCGPAATAFAGVCCAQGSGPILWITESWRGEALNPLGLTAFTDPRRLLMVRAKDQADTLASAEEALRAGAVDLVVIELSKPLSLTAGRRLQLAAEAGQTRGLCLIPEGMGSNAAETRWQAAPLFDPEEAADSTLMRWSLIKNKSGTLEAWDVRWNHAARRLDVVSPTGQRPEPPDAAG
ncbi:ImuA family protein [Pseudodonghicola sp.]|uniref:ImuA family protein n=1 Tax=Pseudodonghicola sp. TaxID=1969463 RepID=UPI003A96F162